MVKKTPKSRYPINLERSYSKALVKLVNELSDVVFYEYDANISRIIKERTDGLYNDSAANAIKSVLDRIKGLSLGLFNNKATKNVARKHVNAVNTTSKAQTHKQMRLAGITPFENEPWLQEYVHAKVNENVSYIKSISSAYTDKVEQIVMRGVTSGKSTKEIRDELLKETDATRNRAEFIARDQTGTIMGQITAKRHKSAGIPGFMWSDSGDNNVRPSHVERNGKYYSYDDPDAPIPGEEYGCRCVAIPEFDESKFNNSEQETEEKWTPPKPLDNLARYDDVDKMIAEQGWEEYDWDFFEASDISRYTGHDFEKLNKYLRTKAKNKLDQTDVDKSLEELDTGISKSLNKVEIRRNMIVYRAVKNDLFLNEIDVENGVTKFVDSAYVSTTPFMDSSFIKEFVESASTKFQEGDKSARPYILIEIEVPAGTKGAYIAQYSKFENEKELLLQKNTVFEFIGDKYDEKTGIRTINLQVVEQK